VRAQPEFAATVYVTVPFPEPDAPPEIVIQDALLELVHAQSAPFVTAIDPPEAPADVVAAVGAIAAEAAPADCVTVNVLPATVRAPERPEQEELAATA
jgi:hypothetical protein